MKYIKILEDVTLSQITGQVIADPQGQPVKSRFRDFIFCHLVDPKFTEGKKGADGAIFVNRTARLLEDQTFLPGEYLAVEDAQYEAIRRVVEDPTGGYVAQIQHCLVPFILAVREASDHLPS